MVQPAQTLAKNYQLEMTWFTWKILTGQRLLVYATSSLSMSFYEDEDGSQRVSRNCAKLGYFGSHPSSARVLELFNFLPRGSDVPAKQENENVMKSEFWNGVFIALNSCLATYICKMRQSWDYKSITTLI